MESRRVCVRGIIVKNGRLFAQRLKDPDGTVKDFWCTPGGGVDSMESLHAALHREMIEETGVAPTIGRLVFVQQFATNGTGRGEDEQLEFFFEITNADDYESVALANTSHGEIEIAEFGFIDPTSQRILPTILSTPEFMATLGNPAADVLFHTEL